jgi:4-amino-4-deoxy-L-arabinose transferase-like glycosyltransferase
MRYHRIWLLGVLFLAFALRIAYWERSASFGNYALSYDDDEYYQAAVLFADGEWLRDPYPERYTRSPGYPLFLVPLFAAFGTQIEIALVFQIGISVLTVALVYVTTRRAFGARAGLVAAALMALAPTYISLASSFLLTETLFTFCILLFIYLFWRWTEEGIVWRCALLVGLLLGYTTLIRGQALYFFFFAAAWFLYDLARRNHLARSWNSARFLLGKAGVPLVLTLIGMAAVIAPWTWRNQVVYNRFILLDTNSGWTVWRDHQAPNDDFWTTTASIPNPGDRSQYSTSRGIQNILNDPLNQIMVNGVVNLSYLSRLELDSFARGGGYLSDVIVDAPEVWHVLLNDIFYSVVFLLALAGILLNLRRLPGLLVLWLVFFAGVVFLFHMQSRFRAHFLFALIVFAGAALARGASLWSDLSRTKRLLWLGAAGLFLIGMYSPRLAPVLTSEYHLWRAQGHSLDALQAAVDAFPEYTKALDALGDGYRRAGDFERAIAAYDRALTFNNFELQARLGRMDIFRQQGDVEKLNQEVELAGALRGDQVPAPLWWSFDPAPTRLVELGDGASSFPYAMNFYAIEQYGDELMRFSQERSFVKFPGVNDWEPKSIVLYMRAVPLPNQPPAQLTVLVNSQRVAQLQLDDQWRDYEIPLDEAALASPTLLVELKSPTFRPKQVLPNSEDPRELGVMVGYVELR